MLAAISGKAGNTDIAISVVTFIELAHGAARADTSQRKEKWQQFIQELLTAPQGNLTLEGFHAMLNALSAGSEGLPNLPTESFTRESFYEDRA